MEDSAQKKVSFKDAKSTLSPPVRPTDGDDDVLLDAARSTRVLHVTEDEWRYLDTATHVNSDAFSGRTTVTWWTPSWLTVCCHLHRRQRPLKRVLVDPEKGGQPHDPRFHGRSLFLLPLAHPSRPFARLERASMVLLDATYTAFIVPIGFAFADITSWNSWYWIPYIDTLAGAVILLDIFFNFHCGFYVVWNFKRRLILQGDLIGRFYLWHGTFVIDILSIIPWIAELVDLSALTNHEQHSLYVFFFQALRLSRLVRLFLFIRGLFATTAGGLGRKLTGRLSAAVVYFISLVYTAAVLINLLGCLWYWTAAREGLDKPNIWLRDVGGNDIVDANPVRRWVASIYFVTTSITTVGYGDVTAQNAVEELVAILIMLTGVLFFGFVISSLANVIQSGSRTARMAAAFRHKYEQVELWMHRRHLPPGLQRQITSWYSEIWVRQEEWKEEELFMELPISVRAEVADWLVCDILRQSQIFGTLSADALRFIAYHIHPRTIYPGHLLCRQGDEADSLWVLSDGEVTLIKDGYSVGMLEAPAVLGESVMLTGIVPDADIRPFSIRALGAMTVWQLPLHHIERFLARHGEVKEVLLPALMARHRGPDDDADAGTVDDEQMKDRHPSQRSLGETKAFHTDSILQPPSVEGSDWQDDKDSLDTRSTVTSLDSIMGQQLPRSNPPWHPALRMHHARLHPPHHNHPQHSHPRHAHHVPNHRIHHTGRTSSSKAPGVPIDPQTVREHQQPRNPHCTNGKAVQHECDTSAVIMAATAADRKSASPRPNVNTQGSKPTDTT
ncbi:hypothetical protein WJX73_000921 [Symbiochloris irregularis]|uniref:Cyclic nucleotide-binding domain-containing protein n=1 Tax=Symbiochloris irregularis TaxID=706552 RepID=A0AAW1NSD8_9CHLO